jgi:drug/metabolite transporter (DMT)-like permease
VTLYCALAALGPVSAMRYYPGAVAASSLCLLLAAAALHATWNLLLKRAADRNVLIVPALFVSTLSILPLLAFRPGIGVAGWSVALVSGLVEVAYFVVLFAAYAVGDFSVVYPIGRGAAPAMLAVWAIIFIGERPGPVGVAGIILIVAGLLLVGYTAALSGLRGLLHPTRGSGLALGVALMVSLYSIIDGAAVKHVDPFAYTVAIFLWTTVLLLLVMWRRYGWRRAFASANAQLGIVVGVGVLQSASYLAVLYVYSRAPVSYAGAIRESSIVLGALAGWLWLGESFGARRVAGAALMSLGVLLIVLAA